jgi:putative transcriptional regulator
MQRNGWLYCAPDDGLLFDADNDTKWDRALKKIGVDPALLSAGGSA